jgi:NADH-quinone oxidoreductase subunit M
MILLWLILILLAGGVLSWLAARWSNQAPRWITLAAVTIDLILGVGLWSRHTGASTGIAPNLWFEQVDWPWIPQFGIHFHLALDGLSLVLLLLTFLLGIVAVLASWTEIQEDIGFFHFNLNWILAGIVGVFLAMDLFLFYFAWELMLIPMYFLIALWGHERRIYAAVKFFLFTQLSGLMMLLAILGIYFIHHENTGVYTFSYAQLLGTTMEPGTAFLLMLGFFIAFAVKLPMFPFHTWLPDAHTEAPTAGSIILAGLLLKTGGYGLLRFVLPLFPEASRDFAPVAMTLAVIGILYGAVMALAQNDFKRLVAYSSVSHLGFVLLGVFAWNEWALQGALMQMICHGLSTGALFFIAGALQQRMHTRDLDRMGGLWRTMPVMSGAALFFIMASLGLPGLGNFVAEFLVLLGAFRIDVVLASLATVGILVGTIYGLKLMQQAFYGPKLHNWSLPDLSMREGLLIAILAVSLVWLGLYPQPVLDALNPAVQSLQQQAGRSLAIL